MEISKGGISLLFSIALHNTSTGDSHHTEREGDTIFDMVILDMRGMLVNTMLVSNSVSCCRRAMQCNEHKVSHGCLRLAINECDSSFSVN